MKKYTGAIIAVIFIYVLALSVQADESSDIWISCDFISAQDVADLYYKYADHIFGLEDDPLLILMENRSSVLDDRALQIYQYLKTEISSIADGKISDTQIHVPVSIFLDKLSFSAKEMGLEYIYDSGRKEFNPDLTIFLNRIFSEEVNFKDIVEALCRDYPYEMYWFDFALGCKYSFDLNDSSFYDEKEDRLVLVRNTDINTGKEPYICFSFAVSPDYSKTGYAGSFVTDLNKTSAARLAVSRAESIVNNAKKLSDEQKVRYFARAICSLVSYDTNAPSLASSSGNSWELINVFDGNPDTNVVCEGYSKAFKYLCDKTDFNSRDIECHLITGVTGANEGHMWNILHMDDGKNYIVDLTNSDGDNPGFPDLLVLAGAKDQKNGIYKVTIPARWRNSTAFDETELVYVYDDATRNLFSDTELTISQTDYRREDKTDRILVLDEEVSATVSIEMNIGSTWIIKVGSADPFISEANIIWASENVKTASVNSFGQITAEAYGKTVISGKSIDEKHTFKVNIQTRFPDVLNNGGNVYDYIYWAADNGIVRGYKTGNFGPADNCTRAQFIVMLWRMAGRPEPAASGRKFSDVTSDMSSSKAISWAASKGIVLGYRDGTFRPDDPLTRSQIMVIIWRLLGRPEADKGKVRHFSDVTDQMSSSKAIYWASSASIVGGYSNGTFGPYDSCLRRQIATILFKAVKNGYLSLNK